ncbi:hypothetical protein [Paracidovorax wautersii]|uniref:hypothetical protein n=1 Tax=Paracidovorax wautersii TaxID=1177982 RepID=UPI00111419EE|nr:hypothetical protein [Paracidovorax wautersii]
MQSAQPSPVPRANLLVGKLLILQQTPAGFAKEFPHNPLAKPVFVAVLQQWPGTGKFLTTADGKG